MKSAIEVESRQEADQIRRGLDDPSVRAFVRVMGILSTVPTHRAKQRIMTYVRDLFAEADEAGEGERFPRD